MTIAGQVPTLAQRAQVGQVRAGQAGVVVDGGEVHLFDGVDAVAHVHMRTEMHELEAGFDGDVRQC